MKDLGFEVLYGDFFTSYPLHRHDEHEIYLFLEGDSTYFVEGKEYSLCPHDMIIIRKHELHHVHHNSKKNYKRAVIYISSDFFIKYNCLDYEKPFLENNMHKGNKIGAKTVISSGIYDNFYRLKKYSDNFNNLNSPAVLGMILELLHLINDVSVFEEPDTINQPIKNILNYIDNHFTDKISLDMLCNDFFISKYHLCRIFKKATGTTVHKYIEQKRLELANLLIKNGQSKTEAALQAGFNDYLTFYRATAKQK